MRLTTALVAATSASSSLAFLVTPEFTKFANDKIDAFTAQVLGKSRSIDVKCHECPFFVAYDEAGKEVQEGKHKNSIHLDFSTVSGQLQVNNVTIFPLEEIKNQAMVVQAYQTQSGTGKVGATVPVDWATTAQGVADPDFNLASEKFHTYEIDVSILGLAGTPVLAQTAQVMLIDWDGSYYIASVRGAEFNPAAPGENDLELCRTARHVQICRIRIKLLQKARELAVAAHSRLSFLKEWMKTHGPGNKARPAMGKSRPCPGASRPRLGYPAKFGHPEHKHGHGHGHGPHSHRHLSHKIWHALRTFINVLVIPALAGAVIGFTVGFIGMLVGQLVSTLWVRYRQRQAPRYIVIDEEIISHGDEKDGLLAEGVAPPAYEYSDEVVVVAKPEEKSQE